MNDKDNGPRLVSDPSDSDDAGIAKLLRLARHRPEVPARDAEIVKQAARAEWQRTVKAERRRAFYTRGAGGLLAAAAMALLVFNTDLLSRFWPTSGEPVATVVMATGQVQAAAGEGDLADLALNATLLPGTTVETAALGAGVPARVAFQLAGGTSIRLDTGTRVRILSASELALDRGALYADSGPVAQATGRSLEIHTPFGIARDVGTQFIVRLSASSHLPPSGTVFRLPPSGTVFRLPPSGGTAHDLEVQVREGEVILDRDGHSPESVDAGFQLAVLPDGSVGRTPLPAFGGPWDWTLSVLPPFQASGRTLHEVLVWAARESGWQLSYADSPIAGNAAVTVVDGPTDGMSPEDVVATFLLGSGGLSYRLEDGVLRIESAG